MMTTTPGPTIKLSIGAHGTVTPPADVPTPDAPVAGVPSPVPTQES